MIAKLTKKLIENIKPKEAQPGKDLRFTVWDQLIPGFVCVVSPISPREAAGKKAKGQKTFFLIYRIAGRRRKIKIGVFGAMTVEQARKRAKVKAEHMIN